MNHERQSMAERVSTALREQIVSGELRPGQWLRQEAIANRFGTSRIPAREALRQLEGEGLVNLTAHSGARVALLDPGELDEIYQIREQLEPMAIAQSAPRLTDEDLLQLEALVVEMEELTDGPYNHEAIINFLGVDRRFHLTASSAARMPRLLQLVENLLLAAQPYRRAYLLLLDDPERIHFNNIEHRLLLDALRRREPSEAELILRLHIGRTRRVLQKHAEVFRAEQG